MKNKRLEEIFYKKKGKSLIFVDCNGTEIEDPTYIGQTETKIKKKLTKAELRNDIQITASYNKEKYSEANAYTVNRPKNNSGAIFGILPPKEYIYCFQLWKI